MCKRSPCVYLDDDPSKWPNQSPLLPPDWVRKAIFTFEDSVSALQLGDRKSSIEILRKIPSTDISEFVRFHAYYAYVTRLRVQELKKLPKVVQRMPGAKLKTLILERDGFVCQYCSNPVVRTEFFKGFSKVVGEEYFPAGRSDSKRHGVYLAFSATWDHVVPFQNGGGIEVDNLVTSCWPCNFGKYNYTLEQLSIEDPRLRRKTLSRSWNGFREYEHLIQ
jgi:5-methylcytosine-specific restriction endonuclease McrA